MVGLIIDLLEGYGEDHQDCLGAFPFSKEVEASKQAEFRKQLKTMGGCKYLF